MPIQIFCTISFSSSQEKHSIKCARENGEKSLCEQQESEIMEEDYKEEAELEEEKEATTPDLVAFANSCTLHGANHIFIEDGFGVRQTLWAGAFLISLSIFLSQVAGRIFYYLEYHHITQLDELESPQMTFPAVTFCNINRIRVSQLTYDDLLYISPLVGYDVGAYLEAGFPLALPDLDAPDEPLNLYNFYDRNSHQLEDMMLACRYRGEACRPDDFTEACKEGIAHSWQRSKLISLEAAELQGALEIRLKAT
ncbi:Acid-sensing ion channel 1B [Varanus komodoensis]|nr:Acid-sensing ion channel 1B [Varanus komodoensis]